jgi:hypothetical protein
MVMVFGRKSEMMLESSYAWIPEVANRLRFDAWIITPRYACSGS